MSYLSRKAEVQARRIHTVEGKPTHGQVIMKPMMTGQHMTLLEIQYPPGAGAPLHVHQHETLCYVVSGRVRVTVDDQVFELGPGDVCQHPKGVPHGIEGLEQATVLEVKSPAQPIERFLGTSPQLGFASEPLLP
jgi:quercetin dioxygenase-like cupin family protein